MATVLMALRVALGLFGVVVLYLTLVSIQFVSYARPDVAYGTTAMSGILISTAVHPVFLMLAFGVVLFTAMPR